MKPRPMPHRALADARNGVPDRPPFPASGRAADEARERAVQEHLSRVRARIAASLPPPPPEPSALAGPPREVCGACGHLTGSTGHKALCRDPRCGECGYRLAAPGHRLECGPDGTVTGGENA